MKIQKVDEQRQRHTHRLMVSVGLECHLINLQNEILAGDVGKLSEFQQMVQYAPTLMRERLLRKQNA